MTVRQLIAALKKMPQDARVAVCDHDHNDEAGEYGGAPNWVQPASEALKRRGYKVVIHL